MVATIDRTNTRMVRRRSTQLKHLRALVMSQLYPTNTLNVNGNQGNRPDPLVTLANTFSRYAQTQQTAYETALTRSNTFNSRDSAGSNGSASTMEQQVVNAISQILGRDTGSSSDSFLKALDTVFPTKSDGKVSFTPASPPKKDSVAPYIDQIPGHQNVNQNGKTTELNLNGTSTAGLAGIFSAEQVTLYRQVSTIATDAFKVLADLQPFVPEAEKDRVEALRALVRSEMKSLVEEFGRLDEPRSQRVETYFEQLVGPNGHLFQFGERAFFDVRFETPATFDDEAQLAGFELLKNYVRLMREAWNNYKPKRNSVNYPLFSERLSRASVLLPVIAEGNRNLMAAMDSVGFTENERRSSATKFTTLGVGEPELPDITINDLNEWIGRFAASDGPSVLSDSGQYGLEFVTDQADSIFWTVVPILAFTKTAQTLNLNSMPIVAQVLVHERVSWAFDDLLNQFKALADLGA